MLIILNRCTQVNTVVVFDFRRGVIILLCWRCFSLERLTTRLSHIASIWFRTIRKCWVLIRFLILSHISRNAVMHPRGFNNKDIGFNLENFGNTRITFTYNMRHSKVQCRIRSVWIFSRFAYYCFAPAWMALGSINFRCLKSKPTKRKLAHII